MFERIYHIDKEIDESLFLFGARQTGKSTILRKRCMMSAKAKAEQSFL